MTLLFGHVLCVAHLIFLTGADIAGRFLVGVVSRKLRNTRAKIARDCMKVPDALGSAKSPDVLALAASGHHLEWPSD